MSFRSVLLLDKPKGCTSKDSFLLQLCVWEKKYTAVSDHFEPRADSYMLVSEKLLFEKNTWGCSCFHSYATVRRRGSICLRWGCCLRRLRSLCRCRRLLSCWRLWGVILIVKLRRKTHTFQRHSGNTSHDNLILADTCSKRDKITLIKTNDLQNSMWPLQVVQLNSFKQSAKDYLNCLAFFRPPLRNGFPLSDFEGL